MSGPLKNARHERFAQVYERTMDAITAANVASHDWPASRKRFYVYFLVDGTTGAIFYVGKGKGARVYQHRREAHAAYPVNPRKSQHIRALGDALREMVFADDLNEVDALALEKALIRRFRNLGLTNITAGHVHPLETELARIDHGMSLILPYRAWLLSAHPRQLDAAVRLSGSTEAFYEEFMKQFTELREHVAAQLNSIRENSNGAARR